MTWNVFMNWVQVNLRPILELLYFLSGIGLISTIIIGVRQIKIIKSDNEKRDKRLAVEKSIEYIDRYAKNILPKSKRYQEKLENGELKKFNGTFNESFMFEHDCPTEELDIKRKSDLGAFDMANELEIISTVIVSGLADKDTIYNTMGKVYCETVETLYDIICYSRGKDHTELFTNTITLYKEWRSMFETVNTPIG
jgi:hypothetical protein